MNPLAKAISIAAAAHVDDIDKGGNPYILHPLRMMSQMHTEEEKITAILHDVVEDHARDGWTFDRLAQEGISLAVISALQCITKVTDDEDYTAFIQRAAQNQIARKVKIADLEDNMNMLRIAHLRDKDVKRLKKYHLHWQWIRQDGPLSNPPNVYRAYPLTDGDRQSLLVRFSPTHPVVIADHVSAQALSTMHLVKEGPAKGYIIGYADHEGIQSLIVSVNEIELTGDDTPFHITWSSEPSAKTKETGDIVKRNGFTRLAEPIPLNLSAGPTQSAALRVKPTAI